MGSLISHNPDKKFDTLKSKYFSSIDQLIKQHYENSLSEKRLKTNMSICLESKYFDELYSIDESKNQPYIYWLQYLYDYLSIDVRDKEWTGEMLELLDEEQFLSENKYLSQFFFKDFYLSSEPNCIRDPKSDTSVNNDIYEEASLELRTSMNNSNLGMMRALGGSIGPNAIIEETENEVNLNINDETDTDSKYKTYRNKVKKYIEIFRQHIVYKDHPINKVIQIFEKCWVKYIEKHLLTIRNNTGSDEEKANINLLIDNLMRELQNFIIKVQVCLKLFYCRAINYTCFANEKDELMNLITTLFFKTGKIYEITFGLLKIKLQDEVDDMINKYRELNNIAPQQLGIIKQFCLNEITLDYQESILEKEIKKLDEHSGKGNEGEKDENNLDLNDKGVANIYFSDDNLDKKKMQELLTNIRTMKKNFPKNGNYNLDNIKVDIDFDQDDNNIIPESILNKPSYVNEEINSILPKSRDTFDLENNILLSDFDNHQGRITYAPNISTKSNMKNNILFTDNEDIRELENLNNENQIIRDSNVNEGRKTIAPFNYIKIFNCVKFTKDSNSKIRLPYETAIQLLKQIEKYKAPFEKMLIFANLGNEIKSCVDDFWKDMDGYVKSELLGVEAEQLMTIFIYIILKAKINDIVVHCKLIQLFTTTVIKTSMMGYYYSNAEASVSYIQNLKNIKELLKGSIDVFNENNEDY
jgi:hypothetical protein